MFIQKHIQDFQDMKTKYHLEPNGVSFDGIIITDKYVSTHTKERQIINEDKKKK